MKFLIQENLFKEEHYATLIEIMQKYSFDYQIVKVGETIEYEPFQTKNVFIFGSVRMSHLATQMDWYPGSFLNDNHDYEVYSKGYGLENMLNGDSKIMKFGDTLDFSNGLLFIRPTKDSKAFTGSVYNEFEWYDFVENSYENPRVKTLTKDTTIQVCKVKNIQQEIRCWVVNGKVVTSSYYKLGNIVYYAECFDEEILRFAQEMVNKYQPADAFVIDVCLTENGLKIVEINCINHAGFYRMNMNKLINAVMEFEK